MAQTLLEKAVRLPPIMKRKLILYFYFIKNDTKKYKLVY